jgi:hypothetical protein
MRRIFSIKRSRVLLSCVSVSLAFRRRNFRTRRCRRRILRCFEVIGIGLPPEVGLQNYNGMFAELQDDRTLFTPEEAIPPYQTTTGMQTSFYSTLPWL